MAKKTRKSFVFLKELFYYCKIIVKEMKKKIIYTLVSFTMLFCSNFAEAQSNEVPFTQEDRDRIIRLEVAIEYMQMQINDIKTFMLWGFGILFGGMGILIGFVLWDRLTPLDNFLFEKINLKLI